jgi:hypothetical protein
VKPTAHIAKPVVAPKTGRFATLRGLLHSQGSGAPLRTSALATLVSLCALTGALALCSVPALAEGACPNEQLRGEQGATHLPDCRAYEMVSPVYKGGYGATKLSAIAPDGNSVAFFSLGVFAGAPNGADPSGYIARRGESGWTTMPLMQPASLGTFFESGDFSATLGSTLVSTTRGPNDGASFHEGDEAEILLHQTALPDTEANWEIAGGFILKRLDGNAISPIVKGASGDFSHILIEEADMSLEAVGTNSELYDLVASGAGSPALRLVGVNNSGSVIDPSCGVTLGLGQEYAEPVKIESGFNAVADHGKEIFFTTCVGGAGNAHQLFVRLDGARTIEVSKPVAETCTDEVLCQSPASRPDANFSGASEDGSSVFFTTTASLSHEDEDTENDLYMASIGCAESEPGCEAAKRKVTSLVQVSHDPHAGEAAEVQGVVRVAPDGQRVYFVARGDLLGAAEEKALETEGRAVPHSGADNLYVYDKGSGRVAFVADVCSGPALSGEVVGDLACPLELDELGGGRNDMGLWGRGEAQTAGSDGRYLVFSSYGRLVANDTDASRDVYRYDAVSGVLGRVSLGEAGYDANGNDSGFDASITPGNEGGSVASQYELNSRAVSEDGSRIAFESAGPLSPLAENGLRNVYEWRSDSSSNGGTVSLVSSGSATEPDGNVVISPSGRDLFFQTTAGLVPQDGDGAPDLYDARVDGGFAEGPAPREPCAGDACQGPLTVAAPLLVPGSVSQAPGEKFLPPPKAATKVKGKLKKPKKRKHKGKARRSRSSRARVGSKRGREVRR